MTMVTVLGATGFVGARLVERLRMAGATPWTPAKGDSEILRRDLGVVYYCAGLTADFDRRPFDTVEAHASLLNQVLRADRFERLVYCSSTRLYDSQVAAETDETTPLVFEPDDPRRTYDLSKALGENLTLTRANGRGAVARLSNVFDAAEGAPGFLSQWLSRARCGRDIELASSPNIRRDYIHLEDVITGLIAIAQSGKSRVFNVASGELLANREIADVFEAEGWRVQFSHDADPPSPPNAAVVRLAELGVRARPVKDVVAELLRGINA